MVNPLWSNRVLLNGISGSRKSKMCKITQEVASRKCKGQMQMWTGYEKQWINSLIWMCQCTGKLKLKLSCDRRSAGHCILVSTSHLELMTWFYFFVWQLWVSCVEQPLWWEDGSGIYSYNSFWALPDQSLSVPSSAEPVTILYSHLRLSQPRGPGLRTYIPQEQGGPGHWVPFSSPVTTHRATVEVF
jgi:hypothetical protein